MSEPLVIPGSLPLDSESAYTPHMLHGSEAMWQETNCYVDLWIELLGSWQMDPCAALGFTVSMDFEDDQFTFFKFPADDLERLYGVTVQELSVYDTLDQQVQRQTLRGNAVLVEVDAFYLPDARATSYRRNHTKTTIAIEQIDPSQRSLGYFHNAGYWQLSGDDYDGLFRHTSALKDNADLLAPYVEVVKHNFEPVIAPAQIDVSLALFRKHLRRRPRRNPITGFREAFPQHLEALLTRGDAYFHVYAFNTLRQLGANFELLGRYLLWLRHHGHAAPEVIVSRCQTIASEAKVLQFRLARAVARGKRDTCDDSFDVLELAWNAIVPPLAAQFSEWHA
jgi:hypothetical protein